MLYFRGCVAIQWQCIMYEVLWRVDYVSKGIRHSLTFHVCWWSKIVTANLGCRIDGPTQNEPPREVIAARNSSVCVDVIRPHCLWLGTSPLADPPNREKKIFLDKNDKRWLNIRSRSLLSYTIAYTCSSFYVLNLFDLVNCKLDVKV